MAKRKTKSSVAHAMTVFGCTYKRIYNIQTKLFVHSPKIVLIVGVSVVNCELLLLFNNIAHDSYSFPKNYQFS